MNIIFPLVTFKYASGIISASGVGAASYASAIIGYFSLIAQLGINTYALAEGAKLRSNKEKFDEFCNIMFTINVISTVFAYLVLGFFLINVKDLAKYRELILIYSATIGLTTIGMEWIFVVEERFIYITARSIIMQPKFQRKNYGKAFIFSVIMTQAIGNSLRQYRIIEQE